MENRQCLECKRTLYGRRDKKFCDDSCRNNYNNRLNGDNINFIRRVNRTLKKNRQILQDLSNLSGQKRTHKTHREIMMKQGFNFDYFTNEYKTKEGKLYRYVYNYGYMDLGNGFVLIVKKSEKK